MQISPTSLILCEDIRLGYVLMYVLCHVHVSTRVKWASGHVPFCYNDDVSRIKDHELYCTNPL